MVQQQLLLRKLRTPHVQPSFITAVHNEQDIQQLWFKRCPACLQPPLLELGVHTSRVSLSPPKTQPHPHRRMLQLRQQTQPRGAAAKARAMEEATAKAVWAPEWGLAAARERCSPPLRQQLMRLQGQLGAED